MHPRLRLLRPSRTYLAVVAFALLATPAAAFRSPWKSDPWPQTSFFPVVALDHPTGESVFARGTGAERYRFAVFGDQRALADGEWQQLVERIAAHRGAERVAFIVDTGDFVDEGTHSD